MRILFALCLMSAVPAFAQKAEMVADVTLNPAGDFKAKTSDVRGFAVAEGDRVSAKDVVVDLRTISTGLTMRDKHAKEKYLDTAKFPEAVLVKAEGKGGKGTGVLRLKGVEAKISGTYTVEKGFLTARFPLKLSDFKIEGISYKGIGVEDEVKVEIKIPLKTGK